METEQQQMQAFQLISKAGDSFSQMMTALNAARKGDFVVADQEMAAAKKVLVEAHNLHTQMLVQEAQGKKSDYSPIAVHAQDHMTKAGLGEIFITEQIEMYKMIYELKEGK